MAIRPPASTLPVACWWQAILLPAIPTTATPKRYSAWCPALAKAPMTPAVQGTTAVTRFR